MARLLLAGYFGCGNLGDDAVLLGFVQGLGNTRHELKVLSGVPEDTYRLYGVETVARKDVGAVNRAIAACDALVFPGGSIFQDSTSVKSVAYYHTLVKKAKSMGKKVFLLAQGVGPVNSFFGKRWTSASFGAADVVSLRDPGSLDTLKKLGFKGNARVTADMAFLLPKTADAPDSTQFNVGSMRAVGIAPRPHGNRKETVALFGDLARMLFNANFMPVLIEMDRNVDGDLIQEISKAQGGKIPDMRKIGTPMQVQQRLSRMDAVIAMRLHAGILAATVGIPPLMVSYDPKVTAFAKLMDLGAALSTENLTAARLFETFQSFIKDRDRNQKVLDRKLEEQKASAQTNIELLEASLGRN
jgi:polysaccharide pyruvyl transferase CsaB